MYNIIKNTVIKNTVIKNTVIKNTVIKNTVIKNTVIKNTIIINFIYNILYYIMNVKKIIKLRDENINNILLESNMFSSIRISPIVNKHVDEPPKVHNTELFDNKKIMIYSHYSKNGKVDSYNYYMINLFSNLVDTVFILSNLTANRWSLNKSNIKVLNYDLKSDFSNLYVFIMRYKTLLTKVKSLFLINDSFLVVDKPVFEKKIKDDFFSNKHVEDYQGLILSKCHNIHYQSYFLCIQRNIISRFINYFKQKGFPSTYEDAIIKYELGLSKEFLVKNIKYYCYNNNPTVSFPFEVIKKFGIIKRQQLLSTYKITGQITCNQIQDLKHRYIHNSELVEYINSYSCR